MADPAGAATRGAPPILGWLGWAGLDAVGRLALLTGSTIIFTRMLAPRDFGVAALVLTIVTTAAIFVGAPFEEALAQRRHVRMQHLRAALGASFALGVVILAASAAAAPYLADYYGEQQIRWLLPAAMTQIFFSGHSDIATALARRMRRFNDVAYATLCGHVVGVALSLALGFAGFALWALTMQRPIIMLVRAIALQRRLRHVITPIWSPAHAGQFGRFAGLSFLARFIDNLSYVCFNNIVGVAYGLDTLGQFNMAMRLIEPIRGAVTATSHNLAFSFFARASHDPGRLRPLVGQVVGQAALVTTPAFVGLAAIAPHLMPLVAGAGWEPAAHIAICLSLGGALAAPAGLVFTAFSAVGRPEANVRSLAAGMLGLLLSLALLSPLGPISVGLARVVSDAIRASYAIFAPAGPLGWTRRARWSALGLAWALAAAMGAVVAASAHPLAEAPPAAAVAAMLAIGVVVYTVLLAIAARDAFGALLAHLPSPGGLARKAAR